jgi:hypothetical protein
MTRLSCHRFRANEVRLWLSLITHNRSPSLPAYRAQSLIESPNSSGRSAQLIKLGKRS